MSASEVVEHFNSLDIRGFFVRSFEYRGAEKLVFRLSDAQRCLNTKKAKFTRDYELQFNRVLGGLLEVDGSPGEILSLRAHHDSSHINDVVEASTHWTCGESFCQFVMTFGRGKLDVFARDFHLTIVAWGTLTGGNGGGGGEVIRSSRPTERKVG